MKRLGSWIRTMRFRLFWWIRSLLRDPVYFSRYMRKNTEYDHLIANWQKRELLYPELGPRGYFDLERAKAIHKKLLKEFTYVKDEVQFGKKEYWATSKETALTLKGDCEDFAILLMRRLWEAGFSVENLCVVIVDGHAFCGLYPEPSDFIVLDNGYITNNAVAASKLFPVRIGGRKLVPICGFNAYNKWAYES